MSKKPAEPQNPQETPSLLDDIASGLLSRSAEGLKDSLSPEQISSLGSEAAIALSSPLFQTAYGMVLQELMQQWLTSQPGEEKLRESLYLQARNLFSLEAMMVSQVNQAQQLNLSEAEKAEQDLIRYEDEQGFGLSDLPGYQ